MTDRQFLVSLLQNPSWRGKTRREFLMEAYYFKCRAKREIKNPKSMVMKNGRPAAQGECPVCGTKVSRIGKG